MKAEKEGTSCLLDVAGKGNVNISVIVPVIEIKYISQVQEPVIKDGLDPPPPPLKCKLVEIYF